MGGLGASLATMVANLSAHKRGWDDRWEEFSDWAVKGQYYVDSLLKMVDEDTSAFNMIMEAFSLSKSSEEEKNIRKNAIQEATRNAIEVPFKTMKLSFESMELIAAMAEIGNPNSVSDAGVAALAARSAVIGAFLNVKINTGGLEDKEYAKEVVHNGQEIVDQAMKLESSILEVVNSKI
jgi:glutamate formiminotransferase/formiminotetrahydrofolate cyclodeaminase